jgi:hypothetical protein
VDAIDEQTKEEPKLDLDNQPKSSQVEAEHVWMIVSEITVGSMVGEAVGERVGIKVGFGVGSLVGIGVGKALGLLVLGLWVGSDVGDSVQWVISAQHLVW